MLERHVALRDLGELVHEVALECDRLRYEIPEAGVACRGVIFVSEAEQPLGADATRIKANISELPELPCEWALHSSWVLSDVELMGSEPSR